MYKIVTHPGSAHKDDFLATCVLLATLKNAEVFRREPNQADLDDINTYVIDVGLEHDPERHNFDHHQDHSLPCAFHLLMQHLGHHEAAMQTFAWYPHMSMMDVRGPHRTAEHLGVDLSVLFAASSPIEGYVLSKFAGTKVMTSKNSFYRVMKDFGRDMIDMISRKMERLEQLKKQAQVLPVKDLKVIYSDIAENPKLSMELFLKHLDDDRIVMSITPSNRGEGWELLRIGDNLNVDFRKIGDHPEIRFVHINGFLAKTHRMLLLDEVLDLATGAIID
jgi:hypothetical protein